VIFETPNEEIDILIEGLKYNLMINSVLYMYAKQNK